MTKNVTTIQKEFLRFILRDKSNSITSLEHARINGVLRSSEYQSNGNRERTFNKLRNLHLVEFMYWRRNIKN